MTLSDPIADMLTRLRNGSMARKKEIVFPFSKVKENIIKALQRLGFVLSYTVEELDNNKKNLNVKLKYILGEPAISKIIRDSKVGGRVYYSPRKGTGQSRKRQGIPYHAGTILSTNLGVLSEKEARQKNVGGEKICTVW